MQVKRHYISKIITPKNVLLRIIRKFYPRFLIYKQDIFLCAFPKSGSTWMRFILTNIISLLELNGVTVDYKLLNGEMRASYDSFSFPKYGSKILPVFLATHRRYDSKIFGKNRTLLILRNPADTLVSYFEYLSHRRDHLRINMEFTAFIHNTIYGLPAWVAYTKEWVKHATVTVMYEDLKRDPFYTIKGMLNEFGIIIPDPIIEEAIERSSFKNIRKIEENLGLDSNAKKTLDDNFRFARKGIVGDYKNYFNVDELKYLINVLQHEDNPYSKFYKFENEKIS